tara:strand:- start:4592 stop:5908 length:1317 start_codon:yes stop_codon:yes gene_type:complete
MSVLHIVHCIDTEGPLTETLPETFKRLKHAFGITLQPSKDNLFKLQNKIINLNGQEEAVAKMLSPELLSYNNSWADIDLMLEECMSDDFRMALPDDFNCGWVYSWHCMDHMSYPINPRHKDVGYGNVFRHYRDAILAHNSTHDEINWHFHPVSITKNPLNAATSYTNSYHVLNEILCRRILEDSWFPTVNRPGFHAERPDSHAFLEQWIPFDYANQFYEDDVDQPDLSFGRFGDWARAPSSWRGYHPSQHDYQKPGDCNRTIFRCLNVGTRLRELNSSHIKQAFEEARQYNSAIIAFADHDYRDIRRDVLAFRNLLNSVRNHYSDVKIKFSGAESAARELFGYTNVEPPKLTISISSDTIIVKSVATPIFGPQPFLALMSRDGHFYHDNLDVQEPGRIWTYKLDAQTLIPSALKLVGVGSAGLYGKFSVTCLDMGNFS